MRAFKLFPKIQVATSNLSKDGLKRLEWFDFFYSHGENASLTCRHYGISRDTFYTWKKRFNPRYLQSLEFDPKTRKPHHVREMTTPRWIQKKVYDIRFTDLEKSKYEIQEELRRQGIIIGYNTIQKVVNKYPELQNIQHKRQLRKHTHYKIARIKAAYELKEKELGSLVQMDTKYLYVLGQKFYIFSAIDCKSRFAFIYAYKTISSSSGRDFLKRVKEYFPFPIHAVNTDNGSEYLLYFHEELEKQWKVPHYFTDPHCPKQNSRVERLHQTAEYEFFNYQELLPELDYIREQCMLFNTKYNTKRFHRSLGYKTPKEVVLEYQKGVYGI